MHCGHLTARAKKPEAASRRALCSDQRQETPYVPSPAFVRARSATARTRLSRLARQSIGNLPRRSELLWLPQAPQAHNSLPIER